MTGRTIGENILDAPDADGEIIRPLNNPFSGEGGLVVLKGNLAPEGAVAKKSAVPETMLHHKGPARVFESEAAAVQETLDGNIRAGDVIVIRAVRLASIALSSTSPAPANVATSQSVSADSATALNTRRGPGRM